MVAGVEPPGVYAEVAHGPDAKKISQGEDLSGHSDKFFVSGAGVAADCAGPTLERPGGVDSGSGKF